MSEGRLHPGNGSESDVGSSSLDQWVPIPIVQVDLGALTDVTFDGAESGRHVWVEVAKDGQIVGIVEAVAENGGLSASTLTSLTMDLATAAIPSHKRVANKLLPKATVVVPTICTQPSQLLRAVGALLELDYPDFEIIIVDNRSGPQRPPLPEFPDTEKVRIFEEPQRGTASARNRGIINATGEFVAFTDDDAIVDINWLRELGTRLVKNPEVDGVGGLVLPFELNTQPQLWFEEFYGGFTKAFTAEIFSIDLKSGFDKMFPYAPGQFGAGCNMAFRLSTLIENRGFDECLGTGTLAKGGEDLALFLKLVLKGKTLAFEPRALARHSHRSSEKEFFTQVFDYGAGLTAMFTALIIREPRHILAMTRRIPEGIRLLTKPRSSRSMRSTTSYPRRAHALQILGMAYGPLAYLRSVAKSKSQD